MAPCGKRLPVLGWDKSLIPYTKGGEGQSDSKQHDPLPQKIGGQREVHVYPPDLHSSWSQEKWDTKRKQLETIKRASLVAQW